LRGKGLANARKSLQAAILSRSSHGVGVGAECHGRRIESAQREEVSHVLTQAVQSGEEEWGEGGREANEREEKREASKGRIAKKTKAKGCP